jgi:poly-beta-1,6-N-acetyl-D-glucosamine biosynthesis protein PgaD
MKTKTNPIFLPTIITSSGNVSWFIRLRDAVLTIMLWLVYVYLLHDCYYFILDIYHWLHDGDGTAKAYPKLRIFEILSDYGASLLVMASTFIGWALYNRLRFSNKKRRKRADPIMVQDLGNFYKLDPEDLEFWQKKRSLIVHNDQKGRVVKVEVSDF